MIAAQTGGDLYDRCVAFFGDDTAITYGDRSLTYAQLGDASHRLMAAFQEIGMRKGDTVAFLMANCPEVIVCEYALAKIGCVRVPLSVALGTEDHLHMMNLTQCKALIYHDVFAERLREMVSRLEATSTFICVAERAESVPQGHLHLQGLIRDYPPTPQPVDVCSGDLAGIYFTGGTSGKPKGVMGSHRGWVNTVLMELLELGFAWNDVFAFSTPLTHGAGAMVLPVMLRQGRCVILDRFDPGVFFKTVQEERITATFLVPTMIYMLMDHIGLEDHDLSSLTNIIYGASAMDATRLEKALSLFGPVFTQLYGLTEAPLLISVLSREDHITAVPAGEARVLGSAGRPTLHTRLKIVDDSGNSVNRGAVGEIIVQCSNIMEGYYNDPAATRSVLKDGWLHTGDIAFQNERGFLHIVDRKKDMIVSGGLNISPREVEDVLYKHPAVHSAAVIGAPNDTWGEEVKALVVLKNGKTATEEELIDLVKAQKGSVMAPKSVEFRQTLPLTVLGKMDKKAIRAEYWKGKCRAV